MKTQARLRLSRNPHGLIEATVTVDDDEDESGETLGAELIADTEDGLNAVEYGDIAADYGAIESGDDAEKADSSAEFYGPDDEDEDEQSESETAAEVLFAEYFLDRFGGEDEVMAGNLKNDVLRSMSATGWESVEIQDTEDSMRAPLTDEGAISRGSFGSVLRRDRFMEISRNLHFNPNNDPRAQTDSAWKIRKVVEVLQKTFARGYVAPSHLAFDEAILPSRSSFNKMRVYMKDKPHRWGTKLFMLCSAATAYCIRYVFFAAEIPYAA
ncbi:unnamed protein product [Phytophthora fragariaefolia]|uniref:Unnamed protein product n=1 Tax=Phytophthora fragariaefolia TaxID=1490495 RepID=A0A9W7DB07_9STRA|nr:unnamed protein product [Phytophthora fragariaefolia]